MSEQNNLIKIEELVVKLNKLFSTDFSVVTIKNLRTAGVIPAIDTRTPGTKMPRWKYEYEKVKEALENTK
jgi:hypothetical protein